MRGSAGNNGEYCRAMEEGANESNMENSLKIKRNIIILYKGKSPNLFGGQESQSEQWQNILSIRFKSSASQRALLNSPVQVVDLTALVVELQLAVVVAAADCDFSCSLCQSFPDY